MTSLESATEQKQSQQATVGRTISEITRLTVDSAERGLQKLDRAIQAEGEQFAAFLEVTPAFFVVSWTIVYFIAAATNALARPLWLDEIIALYIAGLPAVRDIWHSLLNATDGNPPLYYLLLRPILHAFGSGPVVSRIPTIAGVWVAAFCVFSFVRRRASVLAAAIATLCFVHSGACFWATEARPYAVVLGFAGVALVCWQRCAEGSAGRVFWLSGLTLTIACMVSTHYYAALMVVPLFCGELARLIVRKRFDWAVTACLAAGVSCIFFWLPLLRSVRGNVAENAATAKYFAEPVLPVLYGAYGVLLNPLVVPGVLCLGLFVLFSRKSSSVRPPADPLGIPAHETAAVVALAGLPLIAFLTAVLVTKTFVVRYVLEGAIGLAILLGFLMGYAVARRAPLGVCMLLVLYLHFNFAAPTGAAPYGEEVSFIEHQGGAAPVVVAEGLVFAPLWYYASEGLRSRLFYVTDLAFARRTTDTTNENIMLKLKPMASGSIVGIDEFLSAHKTFLLYYQGASASSSLDELLSRKCDVALERKADGQLLFRCNCR